MTDYRFPNPGEDKRFPSAGRDIEHEDYPTDGRFPLPGVDTRFEGNYGFDPLSLAFSSYSFVGSGYRALDFPEGTLLTQVPNESYAAEPWNAHAADDRKPMYSANGVVFRGGVGQFMQAATARPNLTTWSMLLVATLEPNHEDVLARLFHAPVLGPRIIQEHTNNNPRQVTASAIGGTINPAPAWTPEQDPYFDAYLAMPRGSQLDTERSIFMRLSDSLTRTGVTSSNPEISGLLEFGGWSSGATRPTPGGIIHTVMLFDGFVTDQEWWPELRDWCLAQQPTFPDRWPDGNWIVYADVTMHSNGFTLPTGLAANEMAFRYRGPTVSNRRVRLRLISAGVSGSIRVTKGTDPDSDLVANTAVADAQDLILFIDVPAGEDEIVIRAGTAGLSAGSFTAELKDLYPAFTQGAEPPTIEFPFTVANTGFATKTGKNFLATNPIDGANVDPWPNETAEGAAKDAVGQDTQKPTWSAADGFLQFNQSENSRLKTAAGGQLARPCSFMVGAKFTTAATDPTHRKRIIWDLPDQNVISRGRSVDDSGQRMEFTWNFATSRTLWTNATFPLNLYFMFAPSPEETPVTAGYGRESSRPAQINWTGAASFGEEFYIGGRPSNTTEWYDQKLSFVLLLPLDALRDPVHGANLQAWAENEVLDGSNQAQTDNVVALGGGATSLTTVYDPLTILPQGMQLFGWTGPSAGGRRHRLNFRTLGMPGIARIVSLPNEQVLVPEVRLYDNRFTTVEMDIPSLETGWALEAVTPLSPGFLEALCVLDRG